MEYYIYITNRCNLNCSYCSVMIDTQVHNIPLNLNYSLDDLEKFITSMQKKYSDMTADIYFFGGEPTIDYNTIEKLTLAMDKAHDYKINYILHTNGLLITRAPVNILNKLSLILLSLNYEKIYEKGKITLYFKQLIEAVEYIKSVKNIPIIGRLTVTSNTSLYTECCLMGNFFDYVYWQLDNCESMYNFNEFEASYKIEAGLLFKYWMSYLRKGVLLKFIPFISVIKNSVTDVKFENKFYCGYGNSMVYIQTDGKCYACCDNVESKTHYIGDISAGIKFPEDNFKGLICNDCEYLKICGGRCGRMHKDFSKERVLEYCKLNKYMFELIEESLPEIRELLKTIPDFLETLIDDKNILSHTEYMS